MKTYLSFLFFLFFAGFSGVQAAQTHKCDCPRVGLEVSIDPLLTPRTLEVGEMSNDDGVPYAWEGRVRVLVDDSFMFKDFEENILTDRNNFIVEYSWTNADGILVFEKANAVLTGQGKFITFSTQLSENVRSPFPPRTKVKLHVKVTASLTYRFVENNQNIDKIFTFTIEKDAFEDITFQIKTQT